MPTDKYTGKIFEGSVFPDDPIKIVTVKLNKTIQNEYLPVLHGLGLNRGLEILMTAMTHAEGFHPGTRSYNNHNPGNIGNTDNGKNKFFPTLEDGIKAQARFLTDIADGKKKAYPLGKKVFLPPDPSPEIWNNLKNYGVKSGNVPGYRFVYNGALEQFLKIYATLPRLSNSYLNIIISYFAQQGISISPTTTLQEIIAPQKTGAELIGSLGK